MFEKLEIPPQPRPSRAKPFFARCVRRFWFMLFIIIILLAVLVQVGRETFPLLNDYYLHISEQLSERLDADISIEDVDATWSGLTPKLLLKNVVVKKNNDEVFSAIQVSAEVSLLASLWEWRIAWQNIQFTGLRSTVIQDDTGRWRIQGLAAATKTNNRFSIEDPLDIFLFGRRIDIADLTLNVNFRSGRQTQLFLPQLQLENDKNFHRLSAAISIDDDRAFKLTLEGIGDPRNKDAFQAKGFLSLNQFPISKVLEALGIDGSTVLPTSIGETSSNEAIQDPRLDLALWFEGNLTQAFDIEGMLLANDLKFKLGDTGSLPDTLQSHIVGRWDASEGLDLVLKNLTTKFDSIAAPSIDLNISVDPKGVVGFKTRQLNIGEWSDFAKKMKLYENIGLAGTAVSGLDPKGVLHFVDVKLTDEASGWFHASAVMEKGQVNAWRGVPEIKNANGYVSANALSGKINVDNEAPISLFLPHVYESPMVFNKAHGQVVWDVDLKRKFVTIYSGLLQVEADNENASGYFHLDLPLKREYGEGQMVLLIGLDKSVARSHEKYVPKIIPNNLYRWLNASVQQGGLSDVGFMYHGSLRKSTATPPAIQMHGDISNAVLAFDPNWPALKNINASLSVDDSDVSVLVDNATIEGNNISGARINLIKDGGRALKIVGAVNGEVKKAMSLLQESPFKKQLGTTFNDWQISGDVSAAVNLTVPLDKKYGRGRQRIDMVFNNADVYIPNTDLLLQSINGAVVFDSSRGFLSNGLNLKLWGQAFSGKITSSVGPKNSIKSTAISFSGDINADDILKWADLSYIDFIDGQSKLEGLLTIPIDTTDNKKLALQLRSDLVGTFIDLPYPLSKTREDNVSLNVNINVYDKVTDYAAHLGDEVNVNVRQKNGALSGAIVNFGPLKRNLTEGYIDVHGSLDELNPIKWKGIHTHYSQLGEDAGSQKASASILPLPVRLNLYTKVFRLDNFAIDDLRMRGLGDAGLWNISLNSEVIKGALDYKSSNNTLLARLDYLRLPSAQENLDEKELGATEPGETELNKTENAQKINAEKKPSALSQVNISDIKLPPSDITIDDFSVGFERYGRWNFTINSIQDGIEVSNLKGGLRNVLVSGERPNVSREADSNEASSDELPLITDVASLLSDKQISGGTLRWTNIDGQNTTNFKGFLSSTNIANVLAAWNQQRVVTSENITLDMNLKWQGAPDEIALTNLQGNAQLWMENGTFSRAKEAGENPLLRLIGLFNFDTLARRIRLDFSDLSRRGYAYDRVTGDFVLSNSVLLLNTPLKLEASTSKMQLGGTIDMQSEKIDAQLVVTLPIGGNLTVAAAFSAGLPAALGVYVVSKLFKKQVDKVSSINYSITGKWAEPKVKVRRIFNDNAAKEKSDTMRAIEE